MCYFERCNSKGVAVGLPNTIGGESDGLQRHHQGALTCIRRKVLAVHFLRNAEEF
jgi:hypothetical protein